MPETMPQIDGTAPPRDERDATNTDVLASKLTRLADHLLRQREKTIPIIVTDEALALMRDAAHELETIDGAHGL